MKIFNSLKKFWNKLFTKKVIDFSPYPSMISTDTVLKVLKLAKEIYVNKKVEVGMCYCIYLSLSIVLHKSFSCGRKYLNEHIPEFNPEFLNGDSFSIYWWPLDDSKSRIRAFDKLIYIYENKNS